ncbi:acetamidase/formamidase family protein [Natronorarus salvus]|uniref:acetamidase/formamidase family protein n=1 Tax=Natronorarus salvus TaxID=3117733 RepID=UPI002F26414C
MSITSSNVRADHTVPKRDGNVHSDWNKGREPALVVDPGDVVRVECREPLNDQITPESGVEDLLAVDMDRVHALTGPISVEGAAPGDVLKVELLEITHEGWGWTGFFPGESGIGLLPERFPEPDLYVWDLHEDTGVFRHGIELPLAPFPGVVGVAPAEVGPHSTIPSRSVGGNLDVKHLTEGSTVYLPVEVEGGLLSIGDCHAAQGDGEVCSTGIEAPMDVTVRVSVERGRRIRQPQFESTGPFAPGGADEPMYATAGVSDDLMDAAKRAVWHMIEYLSDEHGLSKADAYLLSSVGVDLKINELVDRPNWVVSAYVSEGLFGEG